MNAMEALKKLKSLGSAQTRKTYSRHGVTGEMFGVKCGDMSRLVRQIKMDHELALRLWDSGNHDARVLATMIADPEKLTAKTLRSWMKSVDNHVLSYSVAGVARKGPAGRKLMRQWMAAKGEWPAATGWMAIAGVAQMPGELGVQECKDLLAIIERKIHSSRNRVKYSMNTAMIALGSYVPGLEAHAVKVANRVGQVEVDHGLTDCKTPLAATYIRKAAAHQRAKLAKASKKKTASKKKGRRKKSAGRATV